MKRIFVEKKAAFREHTKAVLQDLRESLGLSGAEDLRITGVTESGQRVPVFVGGNWSEALQ